MLCNRKFINTSLKSYKNMKCIVSIVHFYFYFKILLNIFDIALLNLL